MNTAQIEEIKSQVKTHYIIPFSTRDISVERNRIAIKDKYITNNNTSVLQALGIKNLADDILEDPSKNWSTIQTALMAIKERNFNAIVNEHDNVGDIRKEVVKEETQLNYDDRIDSIVSAVNDNSDLKLQNIFWDPSTCQVNIQTVNHRQDIDTGKNDFWQFGSSATIDLNGQQYQDFFLRLICTNGMTTREAIAYRSAKFSKNPGQQFVKFASSSNKSENIVNRCNTLRGVRASLYEFLSVADSLGGENQSIYMPECDYIHQAFRDKGIDITSMSAKKQKRTYTDQNLYDVFNKATYVASHHRNDVGDEQANRLNKVAGEIFSREPNMIFNTLDIFAGCN